MANDIVTPIAEPSRIAVIDENGKAGTLPADQVQDAVFKDKKFTLAPTSPFKPQDIGKDGRINVIDPEGKAGSLPLDQALDAIKPPTGGGGGYKLQSQMDRISDPLVKQNIDLIKEGDDKKIHEFHKNDLTVDENKNFPMVKDGHELSVPYEDIYKAHQAGYGFKDPNFQALYDAHQYLYHDSKAGVAIEQGSKGINTSLPLIGTVAKALIRGVVKSDISSPNAKAERLALDSPEIEEHYHRAISVGTGLGLAAQILAPEGLLGEGLLAEKAGAAVKGLKALEEVPVIASIASNAAKGIAISTPQIADALINKNPKLAAESLGIGALGGIVFGGAADLLNGAIGKTATIAGEKLPGAADKALSSIGGGAVEGGQDLMKLDQHAKETLLHTLTEAGLKESSTAEATMQTLGKVAGGDSMKSLDALDRVAEDKILTGHLSNDLMTMVHGANGAAKVSPELAEAVVNLNQKMDKLFPEGSGSLKEVQKLVANLTEDITKAQGTGSSVVNQFNTQARDLIMADLLKTGDKAALNADAKTVALWGEDKAMQQAANQMQGVFGTQLAAAQQAGAKLPMANSLLKDLSLAAYGNVGGRFINQLQGKGRLPTFQDVALEHGSGFIKSLLGKGEETAGKGWLLKNVDNPNISSYLTMNAIHNTNAKIAQIPQYLQNIGTKSLVFAATDNPIKSILGNEANGLSKNQQFDRLSNKVSMLAGNDDLRNKYVDNIANIMAKNHPELAAGLKQELNTKIMATNDLLHSGNKIEPKPFQKAQRYEPSKEKMAEIEAGLNAIENPYSILAGLKDGKVSSKQVALVQQTHPAIFQEIVNQINKEAYNGKGSSLDYQQRLSASLITKQPMDQSLKIGQALQATYNEPQQNGPQAQMGGKPKKQGNSKSLHADKISSYTTAQRLSK